MARIRTIKPEFWTNERVMECSLTARLLFIGLWTFADDAGRMSLSVKSIKAQVFPSDEMSCEIVRRLIDELSTNGLVTIYEADGREYLQIDGWQHQKIDRPRPSNLPPPPEAPVNHSTIVRRTIDDRSRLIGREGKGEEGSGVEGKGKEDAAAVAARPVDPPTATAPEVDLYRRGKEILGDRGGGLIRKLLDAKGGQIPLARAAIEQASTKQDAREYIGAIIRNRDSPEDLRARGEAW